MTMMATGRQRERSASRVSSALDDAIGHAWRAMQRERRDARRGGALADLNRKWAQIHRTLLCELLIIRREGL